MKKSYLIALSAMYIMTGANLLQAGKGTVTFVNNWKNEIYVYLEADHRKNQGSPTHTDKHKLYIAPQGTASWTYNNSHGSLRHIEITDTVTKKNIEVGGDGGATYEVNQYGIVTRNGKATPIAPISRNRRTALDNSLAV